MYSIYCEFVVVVVIFLHYSSTFSELGSVQSYCELYNSISRYHVSLNVNIFISLFSSTDFSGNWDTA